MPAVLPMMCPELRPTTGDADAGPNTAQNYPVLTSAQSSRGVTVVEGTVESTPNTSFVLDLYSNTSADPSGYGEGESYLGSWISTTDANGRAAFGLVCNATISEGRFITATATDPNGNTSEFSNGIEVGSSLVPSLSISDASLREGR